MHKPAISCIHSGVIRIGSGPSHTLRTGEGSSLALKTVQTGNAIGQPLIGHQGLVGAVSYSPDGGRIVSGSDGNSLRIWNARTGEQIGEPLRDHSDWVKCVAYYPDGCRIVSGSYDKTLRIFDAETGKPVREPLYVHAGPVRSVAYTPDGKRILSGSADNTLRIWDARSGSAIGVIPPREIRWDSDQGCFLSMPPWWPYQDPPPIVESLIHSDAPTQIPHDGWLRTLTGSLFLWVPPKYRDDICCHGPMGNVPPRLKFDWKGVPHGKDWTKVKDALEEPVDE